jgi:HEAT repeat protein
MYLAIRCHYLFEFKFSSRMENVKNMSGLDALIKDISSSDIAVRKNAVFKLGESKDPNALEGLLKALKDSDETIRANAARGLGKINNIQAIDPLVEALNDSSIRVKQNAAWALGKYKAKKAVPGLITLVNPQFAIFTAHGDIGGGSVVRNEELKAQAVPNVDVVVKAIEALGEIGDPKALDVLYDALSMDDLDTVKSAACIAIGKIGVKDSAPKLFRALNDTLWYVRRDAAIALGKLKDERAVPELVKKLNDGFDEVKNNALKALMEIGGSANKYIFKLFIKNPQNEMVKSYILKIPKPELKNVVSEIMKEETNDTAKAAYASFLQKLG